MVILDLKGLEECEPPRPCLRETKGKHNVTQRLFFFRGGGKKRKVDARVCEREIRLIAFLPGLSCGFALIHLRKQASDQGKGTIQSMSPLVIDVS